MAEKPLSKTAWQKGGVSPNPKGRPPVGLSFADKVRAVVGTDGGKLVEMWAAVAYGRIPPPDAPESSSRRLFIASCQQLSRESDVRDRLTASRLLAERGFGQPKQEIEHSGQVATMTRVVHEYHSS